MAFGWGISGTSDIVNKAAAPAIVEQPESQLVAFYSRSATRAEEFRAKFGAARAYTDYAAMLADPELQAVYVGGEVDRHCPETVAAAEAGKHVLVEKPMALDRDQCDQMIHACHSNGVALQVAYYRRYYPQVLKFKELLEAGAIGVPLQVSIDMASNYNPAPDHPKYWRVQDRGGGGALADIGSHRLDVISLLLGPAEAVAGFADTRVHDYAAPDTETLVARLVNGVHLTLRCSWAAGAEHDTIDIVGSTGIISTGALENTEFRIRRWGQDDEVVTVDKTHANRHFPLIDDFVTEVMANGVARYTGEDGALATRLIAGCYESAAQRKMVDIEPKLTVNEWRHALGG